MPQLNEQGRGKFPALLVERGQRFGRGVVLDPVIMMPRRSGHRYARLRCDCGNVYKTTVGKLRAGWSVSCGCRQLEAARTSNVTHGMAGTGAVTARHPLYDGWRLMIRRCEDPRDPHWNRYGGRGIRVCERWHDVRVFVADIEALLGPRPPGMTLDRKDNDGSYEPGNVRWATVWEQNRNRPNLPTMTKLTESQVRQIRRRRSDDGTTLAVLAAEFGVSPGTISSIVRNRAWRHVGDGSEDGR